MSEPVARPLAARSALLCDSIFIIATTLKVISLVAFGSDPGSWLDDHHVEGSPCGHRYRGVFVVDCPLAAVIPDPDRARFVRRRGAVCAIIVRHDQDGIGIAVGQWVVNGGDMAVDVARGGAMDEHGPA